MKRIPQSFTHSLLSFLNACLLSLVLTFLLVATDVALMSV